MASEGVKSPCISVCALDNNDMCIGCYRSTQEITDWIRYSEEKKRQVIVEVNARRRKANEKWQ